MGEQFREDEDLVLPGEITGEESNPGKETNPEKKEPTKLDKMARKLLEVLQECEGEGLDSNDVIKKAKKMLDEWSQHGF